MSSFEVIVLLRLISSEYLMVREIGFVVAALALSLVGEPFVTFPGDIFESRLSTSDLRPSLLEEPDPVFFTQLITIGNPSYMKL